MVFPIVKNWKHPTCPSTGGWLGKLGCYIVENMHLKSRSVFTVRHGASPEHTVQRKLGSWKATIHVVCCSWQNHNKTGFFWKHLCAYLNSQKSFRTFWLQIPNSNVLGELGSNWRMGGQGDFACTGVLWKFHPENVLLHWVIDHFYFYLIFTL